MSRFAQSYFSAQDPASKFLRTFITDEIKGIAEAWCRQGDAFMTIVDDTGVPHHPWQPGEIAEITSMLDQIAMRGKVVPCRKRATISTPSD